MSRILRVTGSLQFVAIVSCISISLTGWVAIEDPSPFVISILVVWALVGMGFGVNAMRGWTRANENTDRFLRGWEESERLTMSLTHLLAESLDHLSTWDRETSDELAERTNTVIRLSFQNFNERNHP